MTATRALPVLALCGILLAGRPAPAGAQAGFVEGSGDSVATLGQLVARAAGLPLIVTLGGAVAHYQGVTAHAEATTADLGLLGVAMTTPLVCGRQPVLRPDQLPQAAVADSAHGHPQASNRLAGNDAVNAGDAEVSTSPDARSTATYTAAQIVLDKVVSVAGARSESRAELVPGVERRAHAEVDYGDLDLGGGAVRLHGVRWSGDQRSGAGGAVLDAQGSFGVAGLEVGGIPVPVATPDQLADSLAAAAKALAPLGIAIQAPVTTRVEGGRGVRVSPLVLTLGGGEAGRAVLGPLLTALLPLREQLLEQMHRGGSSGCDMGSGAGALFTVADLLAFAMEGRGGIDVKLGGVGVTTDGIDYGDPLGLYPPGVLAGRAAPPPPATETVVTAAVPALPAIPRAAAPPVTAATVAPVVRVSRQCESSSAAGAGCSDGMPGLGAWIAIAAALALLGADYIRALTRPLAGGLPPASPLVRSRRVTG